jgi:hypothetical protein
VLERRLLSGPPRSQRGRYRLAAFIPEFATGPTRNFVSPFLYGHPNGAAAVHLERRVQNDRPRVSWTAAGYVKNAVSRESKSVTRQRTSKLIDAQFTHRIPLLVLARSAGRRAGAALRWRSTRGTKVMALSGTPTGVDRTAGGSVPEMGSSTRASSGTGSFGTSVRKHACQQAGSHRRIEHHLQDAFRFLTLRLPISFKDANCGEATSQ